MDLTEQLQAAVEEIPGAVALSLIGLDGLAVETVAGVKGLPGSSRAARADEEIAAWEVAAAELMGLARRAARSLNWGTLQSLTLEARELRFLLRPLRADYFLLLALEREANAVRGQYELGRLAGALEAGLQDAAPEE